MATYSGRTAAMRAALVAFLAVSYLTSTVGGAKVLPQQETAETVDSTCRYHPLFKS